MFNFTTSERDNFELVCNFFVKCSNSGVKCCDCHGGVAAGLHAVGVHVLGRVHRHTEEDCQSQQGSGKIQEGCVSSKVLRVTKRSKLTTNLLGFSNFNEITLQQQSSTAFLLQVEDGGRETQTQVIKCLRLPDWLLYHIQY